MPNLNPRKYRPVIRWHGGKWMIALWLLEHFPPHHIYTEAYGGGASVLLRKAKSPGEVYNDLDQVLVTMFRVLRDPVQSAELCRRLALTPYAEDEFLAAYECAGCGQPITKAAHTACEGDPVEIARRTIVRSFMGYGGDGASGKYRTGFRAAVTSHKKLPGSEWQTFPEALWLNSQRLRRVTITSRPALEILERYDAAWTLHFVDPPYLPSTRSSGNRRRGGGYHVYSHELTEEDHIELLEALCRLKGMVALSGYPSELYDTMLPDWERVERAAYADGGRPRTEVLYLNPAAQAARRLGKAPRPHVSGSIGPLFEGEDDDDAGASDEDMGGLARGLGPGDRPLDQAAYRRAG